VSGGRAVVAASWGIGGWGGDVDGGAVHVQFLLAVVPDPGEDLGARGEVRGDGEGEDLAGGVGAGGAVGAVAFVGGGDLEGLACVVLARTLVVIQLLRALGMARVVDTPLSTLKPTWQLPP